MLAYLVSNMGNIVVGLLILAVVAAIVYKMIKNKKQGKSCCGCENCSHKCH